eukprot:gene15879-biopygen5275
MVDKVIEELIKFPSLSEDDPGVAFTPVRRRALLITIPDATPDISDNEIGSALSRYGTVTRVWKQTWEGASPFSVTLACQTRTELRIAPLGMRGRGRRYSGEIEELAEEEATPISEDEPDSEEKHTAKPEPEFKANETTDSPPIITADPESPSSSQHSTCEKPSTTIECVTTDEQTTDTKSNPPPAPKPKRITTKTKTPEEYAPFTRKSSKRPVPSTPEKNVVRKKPTGENS